MQGTVFTVAKLKIVPSIKNLYHIQCQCVDELSRSRVEPGFFPLAFEYAAVCFIIGKSSISMASFPRLQFPFLFINFFILLFFYFFIVIIFFFFKSNP